MFERLAVTICSLSIVAFKEARYWEDGKTKARGDVGRISGTKSLAKKTRTRSRISDLSYFLRRVGVDIGIGLYGAERGGIM